jgi:integrase/recombinase XerD
MKRESVAAVTGAKLFASQLRLSTSVERFFTQHISNLHTRRTYLRAARYFCEWCETEGLDEIGHLYPAHFEAYLQRLLGRVSPITTTQHRSALHCLFIWLVKEQILAASPVSGGPGPQYPAIKIKTPVVTTQHIRRLLDSITLISPKDYRDRALIGIVVYCFARLNTALAMKVRDFFIKDRHTWVRLPGKGGTSHELPCHSELQLFLEEYIAAAGLSYSPDGPLFRGAIGNTGRLREGRITARAAYGIFHRRAAAAGINASMGAGILHATAISAYLAKGGRLQAAQWIANHKHPDTTLKYRLDTPAGTE